MRGKEHPFECPRCDYKTNIKQNMKIHLNRKNICPSLKSDLDLTDEVKEHILKKRVYLSKPDSKESPQVTNYNSICYMMNTHFTPIELIKRYTEYKNINLIELDEYLDNKFSDKQNELDEGTKKIELSENDFYVVFDDISSVKDSRLEDMNLFYDSKEDKINYFNEDDWETVIASKGIKDIIEKLQEYYFDYYECNIINRIVQLSDSQEKQHLLERIDEYYKFVGAFDIKPYCYNKRDYEFVKGVGDENTTETSERFYDRYVRIKNRTKTTDQRRVYKTVLNIFKKKTDVVLRYLKTTISSLFCNDTTFKELLNEAIANKHKTCTASLSNS